MKAPLKGVVALGLILVLCVTASMIAGPAGSDVADAAMRGDVEKVRSLLKSAADVNAAQGDGMTALHWAAFHANADLARTLLYAGANAKAATRFGITPLHIAAEAGSAPMLEVLLNASADPKGATAAGLTPLMLAALSGSADSIKLLIDKGAEPNVWERANGQTALMLAAANNRAEAITALLKGGADPRIATKIVMPAAPRGQRGQRGGQQGVPGGRGAPPAAGQQTATQSAATPPAAAPQPAAAQQTAVQQQARNNADERRPAGPDPFGGMTALLYAAREGHIEAAGALLDGGVDVNQKTIDSNSALMVASINGKYDMAMYLLSRGADPKIASAANGTPLYGVINVQWAPKVFYPQPTTKLQKTTHLELMAALIDKGADPNVKLAKDLWFTGFNGGGGVAATGATPFWRAAYAADVDAMRLLASKGADTKLANASGVTPLLAASGVSGGFGTDEVVAPQGRLRAVMYLVEELGANVNDADGAPVNAQGGDDQPEARGGGITALHNAAARGDNDMILYLVSKGAKVDVVSKSGQTVVDMANGPIQRVQPYRETIALLEMLGAKNSHKCVSC